MIDNSHIFPLVPNFVFIHPVSELRKRFESISPSTSWEMNRYDYDVQLPQPCNEASSYCSGDCDE